VKICKDLFSSLAFMLSISILLYPAILKAAFADYNVLASANIFPIRGEAPLEVNIDASTSIKF